MPSLADDIMAACAHPTKRCGPNGIPAVQRQTAARIQAMMRRSHRFILSPEVTRAATDLARQHPAILLQMLPMARLPYEHVWIEYRVLDYLPDDQHWLQEDPEERAGIFLSHLGGGEYHFQTYATSLRGERIMLGSLEIRYRLTHPYSTVEQEFAAHVLQVEYRMAPEEVLPIISGVLPSRAVEGERHVAPTDPQAIERERLHVSLAEHCLVSTPEQDRDYARRFAHRTEQEHEEFCQGMIQYCSNVGGFWRHAMAVFVLIASAKHTATASAPRASKHRMVGGKLVPYLAHSTVTLRIGGRETVREISRSLARAVPNPKRAHDVRGHWAHTRDPGRLRNLDCGDDHEYRELAPNRQECLLCGAKRWWRVDHQRGDESLGRVISETKVVM